MEQLTPTPQKKVFPKEIKTRYINGSCNIGALNIELVITERPLFQDNELTAVLNGIGGGQYDFIVSICEKLADTLTDERLINIIAKELEHGSFYATDKNFIYGLI